MITTVVTAATITTVTTVTTVTTLAAIIAMGLAAAVGTLAIVSFGFLLGTKELASGSRSTAGQRLARFLSVGIWPLAITFSVLVATKVAEVIA